MPMQPRPEIVTDPQEAEHVRYVQPVNPIQYERDLAMRDRAARARDPMRHNSAQETLDAAPKVTVILNPTEEDRRYGEAHKDKNGNPIYPLWTCGYNGLSLAYPVGVQIEMPSYIYELYAHNMGLPTFRQAPGTAGRVFSREIPDTAGGVLPEPEFGR